MGIYESKLKGKGKTIAQSKNNAAIVIQRNYRSFKARCERRRMAAFEVFQTLQTCHENEQSELKAFFLELFQEFPYAEIRSRKKSIMKERLSIQMTRASIRFELDDQMFKDEYPIYRMKKINFPLQTRDFTKVVECVVNHKFNVLPPSCVYNILKAASKELQKLPNINLINLSPKKTLVLVGAIHGNLRDLMLVFYKCGLPSPQTYYLFNGDIVDNGEKSIEVLIVILAAFLTFPQSVFLNRGNHEDTFMNSRFGFLDEVQRKYSSIYYKVSYWIDEVWRWMPLASIVNDKIYIAHGGVPMWNTLEPLIKLKRDKYISLLKPVASGLDITEWESVLDIIWGKTFKGKGLAPENKNQIAGTFFDEKETKKFLINFDFDHIIVSNEVVGKGYEVCHKNRLTIVSSASNFYSNYSNKGCALKINDRMGFEYVTIDSNEFTTDDLGKVPTRLKQLEEEVLLALKRHLHSRLAPLKISFQSADPDDTGFVSFKEWSRILSEISNVKLKWTYLMSFLTGPQSDVRLYQTNDSMIDYKRTLEIIEKETFFDGISSISTCAETLFRNVKIIEAIFSLICKDQESITLDDFGKICEILETNIPSSRPTSDLQTIARKLEIDDEDEPLTLENFAKIFSICDQIRSKQKGLLSRQLNEDLSDFENLAY